MRRAVSRAAPLAYQHSRIIFPITRSAWARNDGRCWRPLSPRAHRSAASAAPETGAHLAGLTFRRGKGVWG